MVVHEYRIPLPLSVEEFGRGQLYMVAKVSAEHTSGDEGIEWIKNEPYDNTDGHLGVSAVTGTKVPRNKGQYTLKRYLLRSKVPSIVTHLVPTNALFLVEEAWNAYPHCKTVLVNGYLDKHKFRIDVETMHLDDNISVDNALSLTPEELKHRKVEYLDIRQAHHDPKAKDYNADLDVRKYKSKVTGRGPLEEGWQKDPAVKPRMCAYKLVRADFKYFPLQSTVEHTVINSQRDLFTKTLAKAFSMLDDWHGLTLVQIRAFEKEVSEKAKSQLATVVRGAAHYPGAHASPTSARRSVDGSVGGGAAAAAPFSESPASATAAAAAPAAPASTHLVAAQDAGSVKEGGHDIAPSAPAVAAVSNGANGHGGADPSATVDAVADPGAVKAIDSSATQ